MDLKYYKNEKPDKDEIEHGYLEEDHDIVVGCGTPWWRGGGSGGGGWGDGLRYTDVSAKPSELALKISAGGRLMQGGECDGVFDCKQLCFQFPALLAYIKGEKEEASHHSACLLIKLTYRNLTDVYKYDDVPYNTNCPCDLEENIPHYQGGFPLPEPMEILEVNAKWQHGHYNIQDIRDVEFSIFGVDISAQSLSLSYYRKVAEITVDETFHIKVNSHDGTLCGNKRRLIRAKNRPYIEN